MDSDDSDFYGDEATVANLQRQVDSFDVKAWQTQQHLDPGRPMPSEGLKGEVSRLHNPYAGVSWAWQLTEPVKDFLARLPPSTTNWSEAIPWIFLCNPYIPRVTKGQDESAMATLGKGNENEAPLEEGSKVGLVVQRGLERLHALSDFNSKATSTSKSKAAVTKELNKEKENAKNSILKMAHEARVRSGKWMLFCSPREVDDVWAVVASATAGNELGIAAKVAPKPVDEDSRRDRLICVYTADFNDKADVGRVLQKLRELRLVEARARAIYYKPDAYTYIGIASGNSWDMRASIYSSTDIFPG